MALTSGEIEQRLQLAVELSLQNSKNITSLMEGHKLVMTEHERLQMELDQIIAVHNLAISRHTIADERLTRIENWLEAYLKGIKNGGAN